MYLYLLYVNLFFKFLINTNKLCPCTFVIHFLEKDIWVKKVKSYMQKQNQLKNMATIQREKEDSKKPSQHALFFYLFYFNFSYCKEFKERDSTWASLSRTSIPLIGFLKRGLVLLLKNAADIVFTNVKTHQVVKTSNSDFGHLF